jgi:membrane protease YdiL (CAAX protease family)
LCEELGWTGFLFPRLSTRYGALPASLGLGLLWGLWHAPVVDALGAAAPHGSELPYFFLSFILLLTALRVLIGWVYVHTGSVLLAQLLHASNTGSLVLFSPIAVSAADETSWYAAYTLLLWLVVGVIVLRHGLTGPLERPGPQVSNPA